MKKNKNIPNKSSIFSTARTIYSIILLFLAPIFTMYLAESLLWEPFECLERPIQIINILLYELIFLFFFFLIGSVRFSMILSSALLFCAHLANFYVVRFRGQCIMPWDIFSMRTATTVVDNYDFSLEKETLVIIGLFLILILFEAFSKLSIKRFKWYFRVLFVLVPVLGLVGTEQAMQDEELVKELELNTTLFMPNSMYEDNGGVLNFIYLLQFLNVDAPSGYSTKEAKSILEEYADDAPPATHMPNIIVVMNECFSDLSVLGDFETNIDYMPFVHSLQEGNVANTITGYLNVSVRGGNTANSEFEFLTSNTMAFLPNGSIPYQQYIFNEKQSLASYLRELGYSTHAMHPFGASGWNRNRVYPLLGFDEFISSKYFKDPKRIRAYISDEEAYNRIIQMYEEKEDNEPFFMFTVTMQNHSNYNKSYDNFQPDVQIDGISSQQLTNYLSLMKISDAAFEELCEYFSSAEEDTIVVMFGDHQPSDEVVEPIFELNGRTQNDLTAEEWLDRYKVPVVIYANFDIEESNTLDTSLNYLAGDILELCGIPLDNYQSYLQTLQEKYPIISSQGAVETDGTYHTVDTIDNYPDIRVYEKLQYYQLFE